MQWQYTPYLIPMLLAVGLSTALSIHAWRQRTTPGATAFFWLMLAVAELSWSYTLTLANHDPSTKLFLAKMQLVGYVVLSPALLAFALAYTHRQEWLTRRRWVLMSLVPVVTLLLVWTNEEHGLIWHRIRFYQDGGLTLMDINFGAWFWVHTLYSYFCLFTGTLLIVLAIVRSPHLYRRQAVTLLVAVLIPWVGNVLYVLELGSLPNLDLTPLAFTLTGLAIAWGLLRYRLFDLVPVARDAVVESMSDGMIVLDAQGRIVDLNPAAQDLIGVPVTQAVGRPMAQLIRARRDLVERYQDVPEAQAEITWDRDGERRHYDLRISPLTDRRGRLTGRLIVLRDVTQRVRAEEELRKHRDHLEELVEERTNELIVAKEAAEAASRAKSAFLTSMSHELRTPLNAILGYAHILKRRLLDPEDINGLIIIQKSGEHLLTLITDILDISKIQADKMELHSAPLYFPNFMEHVASIIRARAEEKGLTFSLDPPSEGLLPTWVQADETRLRQVLFNLLDNAVKFTDEGEVVLSVVPQGGLARVCEYGSEEPPPPHTSTLRFSVRDTGIGIASDQLERIFQPFEQAEDVTRWIEGTGLGLPISRQLVRLMGGELHVASEPGRGSTFWFEVALPVTEVAAGAAAPPERVISGYKGPRRTLLVVDDVPSNRAVLVELLRPLGFEVVEAANGQQAIQLARETRPDLILMDRWMPVLDGFEATRQMRRMPELQATPIVMVSASVSPGDRALSREVGIDTFLPKPVSWPDLAALLAEHLKLEWEYEAEIERRDREEGAAVLVPPPRDELALLLDLARMGDVHAIGERAAHIETLGEQYVPFADRLRELAEGFEEKQILTLVKQHMKQEAIS